MRFRWPLVVPLALAQLVSWGSLYYAYAVIAVQMQAELGWPKTWLDGALSAGLAATGLMAPLAGRIIDAHGGRKLMTGGSIAAAVLLLCWSQITSLWQLFAVWIAMGAVFATVLYEAGFAVIARELQGDYRRGIIAITLVAGFASTVFIPLTHALVESIGWRHALQVLAALQIPFGVLIHWLALKGESKMTAGLKPAQGRGHVAKAMAAPAFWFLAVSYAAHAFMFTGLTFNIIPMLLEKGFSLAAIVGAYAVVGPFQVVGRIAVLSLERRVDAGRAGVAGTLLPVLGLGLIFAATPGSPLLYLFAAVYGSGMGIKTIVQATAGPEFLGRTGYGALQGTFAGINYVVQAATPFALAFLWRLAGGFTPVLGVLFASACLSALAFLGAVWFRPAPAPAAS